ncbi:threonine/serine exporter family protein [Speluncibacter jeojiensis]|uniref:Threonine/serine exporter family protein n=1 Tax=Speluncibacter jeojiensis TaxID=2710754 RepID=A0A9X4M1K3_9ACTN|nr:threonine/serine exporter family protein [Corynebacteriales bacterium D3-21]
MRLPRNPFRRTGRPSRATADTVAPPPSPLRPIDLTDDAEVTAALRLSMKVGEVLLASGTGAMDTMTQIAQVAAAYGLTQCDVEVTYNAISISARRGPVLPPVSSIRIVHYRAHDFTRLAEVDRLIRRLRRGELTVTEAYEHLDAITGAPHPYARWLATAAWAAMAGSIAVLLGGGALVAVVAFLTTVVIDRTNRRLNRLGLPYFFQHFTGGVIASLPAVLLFTLHLDIRPSLVIAAGVVVLLPGLSLVGSVQDAITGAPVTAGARFFEVMVLTAGIIGGVAVALRVASGLGTTLPNVAPSQFTGNLTELLPKVASGAFAAGFYALACYAERRALLVAGLAGATGSLVVIIVLHFGVGPIFASACAATVVGLAGGLMARRALTPPIVVAVAGITPLLPGLTVYRGLYAFINDQPLTGFSELASATGIGAALAAGVVLGEWVARTLRRPQILRPGMLDRTGLRRPISPRRPGR